MKSREPVVPEKAESKERELLHMDRQEAWPWPEATKPGGCAERNSHFLKDCQLKLELYLGLWGCFCLKYHVFFKKSKKIVCDSA